MSQGKQRNNTPKLKQTTKQYSQNQSKKTHNKNNNTICAQKKARSKKQTQGKRQTSGKNIYQQK